MKNYIALQRGINVGGKHIVKMAELKSMFERLGCTQVQTYIQSGNVLFESGESELSLRQMLEESFEKTFGFFSSMIIRTDAEWRGLLVDCPYTEREIADAAATSDIECLHVALLQDVPEADRIALLESFRSDTEDYRIVGRNLYMLFRNGGFRNSKLPNQLTKLGVSATVRNWKTVNKLMALIDRDD
ncbi:DUF1697 domain-containing protein [Paenibacillus thailandensis]|uniref:DUF1697 domain-containing protein n=1 Tax=Paenibacillus thailandensis TaxID=393250 RepID=A0ABW5QWU7_9BACL